MRKSIKHTITVFLLLLVMAVPALAGEHENYGYQQLTGNQKAAYEKMAGAIAEQKNSVTFGRDERVSEKELLYIFDLVLADHPEFFWCDSAISYSMDASWAGFSFTMTGDTLEKATEAFDDQVNRILSSIPEDAESDYDKALYLHDLLVEMVDYRQVGYHQSAYGALVDRVAVCAGYTRAYQHLLHEVGIDAFYVSGDAFYLNGDKELFPHAWNLVWLDGKCVYTDVTWDDPIGATELSRAYFNLTYDEMAVDHIAEKQVKDILPKCKDHGDLDYFSVKSTPGSGLLKAFTMETTAQEFLEYMHIEKGKGYCSADIQMCCENPAIFSVWWMRNGNEVVSALGIREYRMRMSTGGQVLRISLLSGNVPSASREHRYAKIVTEPTCTEAGSVEYSCLLCGHAYKGEGKPALGHHWSDWSSINDMQHSRVCQAEGCQETQTEKHDFGMESGEGAHNKKCEACGYEEAGASMTVEGKKISVHVEDAPEKAQVLVTCFDQDGKLVEAYMTAIAGNDIACTFRADLEGCTVKAFFLTEKYVPWLVQLAKAF